MTIKEFYVVLVKPSHYDDDDDDDDDDDGYVIQWLLSPIPSNSLASVYGLVVDAAEAKGLGPDDVEAQIRANVAIGLKRFFITDDNFARNKNWEAVLDRMIWLREQEGLRFKFII